jgi:hypothetical protein
VSLISADPNFEAKFWDVIGLYLNPPEQAMVLDDPARQLRQRAPIG